MHLGKIYEDGTYTRTSNLTREGTRFIRTYRYTKSYRRCISWRRAKKLMKHCHMKGWHKKANVKWCIYANPDGKDWSSYNINIGYSRRRRVMFFSSYRCTNIVEIEEVGPVK